MSSLHEYIKREAETLISLEKLGVRLIDLEENVQVSKEGNLYVESKDLLNDPHIQEEITKFAETPVENSSQR